VADGQLAAGGDASAGVGAVPLAVAVAVDHGAVTADLAGDDVPGLQARSSMPEALRAAAAISGSRESLG
jgi:hypothetical protein